ncbi:MAG: DUF4258 domain-containing protein [Deltaproteobacteria bacterium]|nr:DUF4258 domain-containing protein [Deltaproteobacteria bacterium]
MKIKISRHARNNMRLYGILQADIVDAVLSPDSTAIEKDKQIVLKKCQGRFSGFPLKVVCKKGEGVFVITAYPLKKPFRRGKK